MRTNRLIISLCFTLFCCTTLLSSSVFWTGATDNDWSKPGNWSSGNVPKPGDDVNITVTNAIVTLSAVSNIRSLYIRGNASLTILQNGELYIDVDNEQLDGVLVEDGLLRVEGAMLIENVHSVGGNRYSIENYDQVEIDGHVIINDQTFSGGGGIAGAAIYNRTGTNFTCSGILEVDNIGYDAFRNSGNFEITPTGDVTFGNNIVGYHFLNIGIVNGASASLLNNGDIAFNGGGIKGLLHSSNATAANNHIMSFVGSNFSCHSDFTNTGSVNMNNGSFRFGNLNNTNNTCQNNGTFSISNYVGAALEVIKFHNFINDGTIAIDNCRLGVSSGGSFINNQSIVVTNADWNGVTNGVTGDFDNYGSISVDGQQELNRAGFTNTFNFTNYPSGSITVKNCLGRGFQNKQTTTTSPTPTFVNQGLITVDSTDQYGFFQQLIAYFEQEGTLNIGNITQGVYNGPTSSFEGEGEMLTPNFNNFGIFKMGNGIDTFNIKGDFENRPNGKIIIQASGQIGPGMAGGFDQLIVDGNLILDGDLEMDYLGYSPSMFHTLTPLKYGGALSGSFESFTTVIPSHQPQYSTGQELKIKFENCNGNAVNRAHVGYVDDWSKAFAWDGGVLPYPCETITVSGQTPSLQDTLTLDIDATVAGVKLTNSVLIIPAGKTLEVLQNYSGGIGLDLQGNSAVINNGTLIIQHVKEEKGIYISSDSELINNDEIVIEHISGAGAKVVQNYGDISFTSGSTLMASDIYPDDFEDGTALTNYGHVIMEGDYIAPGQVNCNSDTSSIAGSGSFQIDSSQINGILNPGSSAGELYFAGDMELTSTAQLNIEIAGNGGAGNAAGHDRLYVDGDLMLDGTLKVSVNNGYLPTIADRFDFIFAKSRSGNFAIEDLKPPVDTWAIANSDPNLLILMEDLDCINEDIAWTGNGDAQSWTHNKNWQYDKVPKGCHDLTIAGAVTTVVIDDNESVEARTLTLSNSVMQVVQGGTLNLNAQGYGGDILFNQSDGTIYNEGIMNISNNTGNQNHGIRNEGIIENHKTIHISEINGTNSHGIINFSLMENYDSIRIDQVPNDYAFVNINSSAIFDNTTNSTLEIDNAFGGLFLIAGTQQFQNKGTLRFVSGFSGYTIYASGAFSTLSGAKIEGAVNNGLGVIITTGNNVALGGEID